MLSVHKHIICVGLSNNAAGKINGFHFTTTENNTCYFPCNLTKEEFTTLFWKLTGMDYYSSTISFNILVSLILQDIYYL